MGKTADNRPGASGSEYRHGPQPASTALSACFCGAIRPWYFCKHCEPFYSFFLSQEHIPAHCSGTSIMRLAALFLLPCLAATFVRAATVDPPPLSRGKPGERRASTYSNSLKLRLSCFSGPYRNGRGPHCAWRFERCEIPELNFCCHAAAKHH